jgi:hypothetical protein
MLLKFAEILRPSSKPLNQQNIKYKNKLFRSRKDPHNFSQANFKKSEESNVVRNERGNIITDTTEIKLIIILL